MAAPNLSPSHKLPCAIDVTRIMTMFFIVTGHYMQLNGFYLHFTGTAYPFQPADFHSYVTSISQGTFLDRIFLVFNFSYWSMNFTFFAISGLSLWYFTRRKGSFSLKEYFFRRFTGIYLGYVLAALAAFAVAVVLLNHAPGEHDLNYLLLGATRARETIFYNDTLWFMSVLFVLYLVFPFVALLYSKTGSVGLLSLASLSAYYTLHKHALSQIAFFPTGLAFFLIGMVLAELFILSENILTKHGHLLKIACAMAASLCLWTLHDNLYANILAKQSFGYETHKSGFTFLILFLSFGMLMPLKDSKFLRRAGMATFHLYLFHYLLVRVYNNSQPAKAALDALASYSFPPMGQSILVASLTLFLLSLSVAMAYELLIFTPLSRWLGNAFANNISLQRSDGREKNS